MDTCNWSDIVADAAAYAELPSEQGDEGQGFDISVERRCRRFATHWLRKIYSECRWQEIFRREERTVTSGVLPRTQTGLDTIWLLRGIYAADPVADPANALPLPYEIYEEEAHLLTDTTVTSVWAEYTLAPPVFSGEEWAAGTYSSGQQVSYTQTTANVQVSNFYTANTTTTGSPGSSPNDWDVVEIPDVFREALSRFCAADLVRRDREFAIDLERLGWEALTNRSLQLHRDQQQTPRTELSHTY